VNRLQTVAAILLLALWVPITSHEMLEMWGLIHTQALAGDGSGHEDDHDAADGICHLPAGIFQVEKVQQPQITLLFPVAIALSLQQLEWPHPSLAQINPSPPDIPVGWQFSLRAALPARAPSLMS
jgi:hypothetical protein